MRAWRRFRGGWDAAAATLGMDDKAVGPDGGQQTEVRVLNRVLRWNNQSGIGYEADPRLLMGGRRWSQKRPRKASREAQVCAVCDRVNVACICIAVRAVRSHVAYSRGMAAEELDAE